MKRLALMAQVLALGVGVLGAQTAHADAATALHNFRVNLAQARLVLQEVDWARTQARPALVRGMYSVTDQNANLLAVVNEQGTLFCYSTSDPCKVLRPGQGRASDLSDQEAAELRAEVMGAIDYGRLLKLTFGNGSGEPLVMLSAIDCPACEILETKFANVPKDSNGTIYVIPGALQERRSGGLQKWQLVSRIWCAQDAATAWRQYWASRAAPAPRACEFGDPAVAELAFSGLGFALAALGQPGGNYTPRLIRQDGMNYRLGAPMPPLTATPIPAGTGRWLSAAAMLPEGGAAASGDPAQGRAQNPANAVGDFFNKFLKK